MDSIDSTVLIISFILTILVLITNSILRSRKGIFMVSMALAIGILIVEISIFTNWGKASEHKYLIHQIFYTWYFILLSVIVMEKIFKRRKEKGNDNS